jgi:Type IV secretion system pilin
MPHLPGMPPWRRILSWSAAAAGLAAGSLAVLVLLPDVALAQTPAPQAAVLNGIITRLQQVVVGLAASLATLFLSIGGVRYLFAGEDPEQISRAKKSFRGAAIGYGVAALSGTLFALLRYIVGA